MSSTPLPSTSSSAPARSAARRRELAAAGHPVPSYPQRHGPDLPGVERDALDATGRTSRGRPRRGATALYNCRQPPRL